MKRYYLSKILQVNEPPFGLVWKHRLQVLQEQGALNFEYLGGEIKTDPATGVPTEKALLCLVAGINHAKFKNDAELVGLPLVAHDIKVSSIHTATKLKCKADIKALGLSPQEVEDAFNNADGFRDVVEHFGRKNNPDFSSDNFDLYEN